MSQKIALISFDNWNYDKHIVDTLNKKGIEAFHIKIGGFKHKSTWSRISNSFSKIFLGKNPKIQKRQEYILKTLEEKGFQDQILVINPELIDLDCHLQIKSYTKKYITYLYDSVDRCPVEHLLHGVFDEIYSFDKEDISKYNFKETTNYNYIGKLNTSAKNIKNQVLYIASFDNRLETVYKLREVFKKASISFRFIIVGKKTSLFKLKNKFSKNKLEGLELKRKRIEQEDLKKLYAETFAVLDIVRENQSGLSFRIFEAMAFQKKIITNNQNIKNYNFYNPINIVVMENENYNFDKTFFETPYQPLSNEIYNEYTLDNWVEKTFNLK
jgi:hypothetical protein